MASVPLRLPPDAAATETVEERFRRLAEIWHRETGHVSSMSAASNHPVYREIIDLGQEVVPSLLRDLEEHHAHWFEALREITGAQPIPKSVAGNIPKMADAWLHWARDNGYRW